MCLNEESYNKKGYQEEIKQQEEIINDLKFKNYMNSKKKKIHEEIKDVIIDKYLSKILSQQKEIEQLKKKLNESIKSSLIILKNSLNKNNLNNNNIIPQKSQKQKLKNEFLNINNNKNDIMVQILKKNQINKNLSYSTISNDNIKLKKSNTQTNGLTIEYKKTLKENNNLSLSSSRIKFNKYDVISPKRIKIEKINVRKTNSKNKKERESHHTINEIDINELNTYYLKEYNKKDNQKIEEIKTKLLNNNLPPSQCIKNTLATQKNKNNIGSNVYKAYSQNKYKKVKNQNLVNKSNNYSYGQNNLKKVFNSPKNIKNQFNNNEKNKCFKVNEYYINKSKMTKYACGENKYLYTNPTYNIKNIIHRNTNNNNNKIYINTDNNMNNNNNLNVQNVNIKNTNKHFKTQTNFYQRKVINKGEKQLSLNIRDIMMTSSNENINDN